MGRAGQERADRDDPLDAAALGDVQERLRVGPPPLVGFGAAEQEQAVAPFPGMAREELAPRPVDVTAPVLSHPHLGPFLREDEERLGIDPSHPRGREIADQVAQGARGRLTGIDPSAVGHHHRRQVLRRIAVKLYMVHDHPFGG
jgi:hypothetical protein